MFRRSLILTPLIVLAACATPREQCISASNRPLITLDRLIAETRGNVQRGFGIEQVQDTRVVQTVCDGRNSDGTRFRFECEETQTRDRNVAVALDMTEEQQKLAQLVERRDQAQRAATARIQQCLATYPE